MTSQVILFICDHCGNTHPDLNSAKICEAGHKQRFQSPREFYRNRDMAGTSTKGKARPKPQRVAAKPKKRKSTKKV